MIRRQIYLDTKQIDQLHRVAAAQRRSASALIREALTRYLDDKAPSEGDAMRRFIGGGSGGPRDAAAEHDKYLYGTDD